MAAERLLTVAIDGPAGAGKSSVAKALARRLGLALVDTGALYRSVALQAHRSGIGWEAEKEASLGGLASALDVRFEWDGDVNKVYLRGEDVSAAIRTPQSAEGASKIAALPAVRAGLLELQRSLASVPPGAVLEGRDIGTVVLPGATAKFFLTASLETRVRRRHEQLIAAAAAGGEAPPELATLMEAEKERDKRDSERAVAPLAQAEDAYLIADNDLTVDETVDVMLGQICRLSPHVSPEPV